MCFFSLHIKQHQPVIIPRKSDAAIPSKRLALVHNALGDGNMEEGFTSSSSHIDACEGHLASHLKALDKKRHLNPQQYFLILIKAAFTHGLGTQDQ